MNLVFSCIESSWRLALSEMAGNVESCASHDSGMELHARIGEGLTARPFLVRWIVDSGVLCEGRREDIKQFNAACTRHGFVFRLDSMALCG